MRSWYTWVVWWDILWDIVRAGLLLNIIEHVPSGNKTSSLNSPPSQTVLSFPGTPHSHLFKSKSPCWVRAGFAKKPKGWSRRHCLLWTMNQLAAIKRGCSNCILYFAPFLLKAILAQRHPISIVIKSVDFRRVSLRSVLRMMMLKGSKNNEGI
jgi:hypothetical protein